MDKDCVPAAEKEHRARVSDLEARRRELADVGEQLGKLGEDDPKREALAGRRDELRATVDELEAATEGKTREWPLRGPCARVLPGVALDCCGDEAVLREPLRVDLWRALSPDDQQRVKSGHDRVWVSICYCERPVEPARPLYGDACGVPEVCTYARIRETVALKVTVDRPDRGARCEPCFGDCPDPCVALARIDNFRPGEDVAPGDVDNGVRRMLTRQQLTTITGISFVHGATYERDLASDILRTGFEVRFSHPVRVDSLTNEVVDIVVFEGGGGRAGDIYTKAGQYVDLPTTEYTDRLIYRQRGGERLENGDRVLIQVRGDFILDECCRSVDGNHIGGRVPLLPGYEQFAAERPGSCPVSPDRPGGWTSGNGTQGGTFETWFLVDKGEADNER
jgi:hypothetical protein